MSEKPIWALSATELVKKTINNELSATEVTSAYLEHIKKVNPELVMGIPITSLEKFFFKFF